jgi:hypothetical protein
MDDMIYREFSGLESIAQFEQRATEDSVEGGEE